MQILIPHSWLLDYLETDATPKKIAECLSLCGPSIDRLEKVGDDWIYDIEVTTNRVDMMSVRGIAREASVILPQFGYVGRLKPYLKGETLKNLKVSPWRNKILNINKFVSDEIKITNNPKLCKRILAIKLEEVHLRKSPLYIQDRLNKVGQRPLNNAIDITNYVMWEIGHPLHVFDYDRIVNKKIIVREAKKGETLITLDDKKHTLHGDEVVFDDGTGEIIDLPGIMGTKNTVVREDTKNVLLWIESIDPQRIRRASMGLEIRSQAAILNEKGVDPELGLFAINRAVDLFKRVTKARIGSQLIDINPSPYVPKIVKTTKSFIYERLGVNIDKNQITTMLSGLEFKANWKGNNLDVIVPSFRANDVSVPEDIIEEVARIYGYHKFPSKLMQGFLPEKIPDSPFHFENNIKNTLRGWAGVEIYTSSLVAKELLDKGALKLTNPLGKDTEYLRTSLLSSLIEAANQNAGEKESFHLFEMANVYLPAGRQGLPRRVPSGTLPQEKMTLAGIFVNYNFRKSKGIIEAFLNDLNIKALFEPEDSAHFLPSKRIKILDGKTYLGQFGFIDSQGHIYYEFEVDALREKSIQHKTFKPIPKYPAQIEDITLVLPSRTKVGEVMAVISMVSKFINKAELTDIYKDSYTFRIWYQHPEKTLTDTEVKEIRNNFLQEVNKKFGANLN